MLLSHAETDSERTPADTRPVLPREPVAALAVDGCARIVNLNRAAEDLLGQGLDELAGQSVQRGIRDETLRRLVTAALLGCEPAEQTVTDRRGGDVRVLARAHRTSGDRACAVVLLRQFRAEPPEPSEGDSAASTDELPSRSTR
ncbi:MAG: PAS domain-containing protein [Candidatus Brocadiaceae bacterium]